MKVGTDGVLLGAWSGHPSPHRILDIGTGTGLIALMLSQRFPAVGIDAIEIDLKASLQAKDNIEKANKSTNISVRNEDVVVMEEEIKYDLIVSNPPFFENSLLSPTENRNKARHNYSLSFDSLIKKVAVLLKNKGIFSVVLPSEKLNNFRSICEENSLFASKITWVKTTPNKTAKRVLLSVTQENTELTESELIIELQRHVYSEEYIALTKDFYLKL